jgi:two-component system KDP operon response regulator KdpE
MKKILIIDDDPNLLQVVQKGLQAEGFETVTAQDGADGLKKAYIEHPDVIILDIMMPTMDGLTTCSRLRELTNVPIIFLTALSTEKDIIKGLMLGADDYVTKPFGMGELVARVQTCLRHDRSSSAEKSAVIAAGDLTIDMARHKVSVRGNLVELSPTEFKLLAHLASNRGKVVPHRTLLTIVWGPEYADESAYLHMYVRGLRRKIEQDPSNPTVLKTERGVGYYIEG